MSMQFPKKSSEELTQNLRWT